MGFENGRLVRVVLHAQHNSDLDDQINVLHYDLEDNLAQPANDPQSLADRFADDVIGPFAALYNSDWTIQPVVVEEEKDPQNPNAARQAWTSGSATPGTFSAGTLLPRACCLVVTLRSASIGRRFTGRMFIGGSPSEADQEDGVWASTILARVATLLAAIPHQPDIAESESSSTAKWCVYSKTQRVGDFDPYASAIVTTQRRTAVHWLRTRAVG
jgi:hypothetical protein